jgi:hypothetical protein
MDTTYPYEAPRSEKSIASAKKYASRLISFRESPMTMGKLYRMQLKVYLLLIIAFGIGVGYFAWLNLQPGTYLMLGALAGVLLRDFGIMRAQTKLWPLLHRLLDWQRVQRMAHGEDLDR